MFSKFIDSSTNRLHDGNLFGFSKQTTLASLVAGSLVIANVTAAKLAQIPLGIIDATVPAGFIGIAVAFLCTDVLSEEYGREAAHEAVNGALIAMTVALGLTYAAIWLPVSPAYGLQQEYATILGQSAPIAVGAITTLFISQNTDVFVFHKIKERIDVKAARNIGSTVTSQMIDTALFIGLAFVVLPPLFGQSATPLGVAWSLFVAQYAVKIVVALLDTPLFYLFTRD